ncbi:hypothetical protein CMQ_7595 [Grosmannia clavigera kw1407]|uniref:Uncharacterized protein n=1 Tax=Grosmannia clavigera (strain kw1407 / UAMH 11150) TaxID=655863 RepID=F0XPN5_GROCL|nr:uncharacterized protein CMQ_7595 [Grosmannia clavigera kw1407]EFX00593.1 hypothetical protein CMQ_7595 [Grosmannia clavigera kw1407]
MPTAVPRLVSSSGRLLTSRSGHESGESPPEAGIGKNRSRCARKTLRAVCMAQIRSTVYEAIRVHGCAARDTDYTGGMHQHTVAAPVFFNGHGQM